MKKHESVEAVKEGQVELASKTTCGFVPISFDRYVGLHVKSNPTVDRAEFAARLRGAVDARKTGARCACGAPIWAIGSAEAWPDADYEIDEVFEP